MSMADGGSVEVEGFIVRKLSDIFFLIFKVLIEIRMAKVFICINNYIQ